MAFEVNGLVLRRTPYRDNDAILSVLTADHGRISLTCRGGRSLKSKFHGYINPFTYSNFIIDERFGIQYIREVSPIACFYEIGLPLERLTLMQYFCEVLEHISVPEQPDAEMMRLALNTLHLTAKTDRDPRLLKAVFELRAMAGAGFCPDLEGCCVCGKREFPVMRLDLIGGQLYCGACLAAAAGEAPAEEETMPPLSPDELPKLPVDVPPAALAAMRYLTSVPLERAFAFRIDDAEQCTAFAEICERYLLSQLGRDFQSLRFYHTLDTM